MLSYLRSFSCKAAATAAISTLSLHDALPISVLTSQFLQFRRSGMSTLHGGQFGPTYSTAWFAGQDRKSTRLNSSHLVISYAVFCLKKKNTLHSATSREVTLRTRQDRHSSSQN